MKNVGKTDVLLISNRLSSRRLIYASLKELGMEVFSLETLPPNQGLIQAVSLYRPKLILLDTLDQPSECIDSLVKNLKLLRDRVSVILLTGPFYQRRLPEPEMGVHLLFRPITISEVVVKVMDVLKLAKRT